MKLRRLSLRSSRFPAAVLIRAVLVLASLLLLPAASAQPPADEPLVVGTKAAPPFSFRDAGGEWTGLSLELWAEVARELGVEYTLEEAGNVEELLRGVEEGRFDAAVAAFTITPEREAHLDFSHPFYISGLGIAVDNRSGASWWGVLRALFSWNLVKALGALSLVLFLTGALLWIFERRRNAEQFGGGATHGLGNAFWWSAVTMTTVGYGDKAPVTLGGRLVALVWMFASILLISGFTAAIASALTVQSLSSRIQGPEDLPRARVGALAQTTGAGYLVNAGLRFRTYETVEKGLAGLAAGEIDALVHDAPILRYAARHGDVEGVSVLGKTFQRQDYGIVLQSGSAWREPLNTALLETLRGSWWEQTVERYLGE